MQTRTQSTSERAATPRLIQCSGAGGRRLRCTSIEPPRSMAPTSSSSPSSSSTPAVGGSSEAASRNKPAPLRRRQRRPTSHATVLLQMPLRVAQGAPHPGPDRIAPLEARRRPWTDVELPLFAIHETSSSDLVNALHPADSGSITSWCRAHNHLARACVRAPGPPTASVSRRTCCTLPPNRPTSCVTERSATLFHSSRVFAKCRQ